MKKTNIQLQVLIQATYTFYLISCCIVLLSCRKVRDFDRLKEAPSISSNSISAAARNSPNIILILADDVGYGIPSVNGGETYETPNIDRMASVGMRFTNCFSAPLCSPSRFMFMSGRYNFRNYNDWGIYNLNEKMMANLVKNAGYATYVAGKWQFDGGDLSIKTHGFDDYSVWSAFRGDNGSHYKDPRIYENSSYLPDNIIKGAYGDDIFASRILSFIQQNRNNKFFVYFPITLCHYPYVPTPDDPEFATWDNKLNAPDTAYFPSMVKYMDKKIGQLMDSLRAWKLFNNTIVMFIGDNGTPKNIWFTQDGVYQAGGKASSNNAGTKVPLIVTWPAGGIIPGQVNNNLIDFTDFVPTVAQAAGTVITPEYGITDGVSFYNQLRGLPSSVREWVFCHYDPNTENGGEIFKRWINNANYKLYDSTGEFYNLIIDPNEKKPIKKSDMTPDERALKKEFQEVMNTLH